MSELNTKSFSSANAALPIKLIKNSVFAGDAARGIIKPVHLQWIPTNRCDADCSFCSCAKRETSYEQNIDRARAAIEIFAGLGARAVTITGGGEPMLYSHIYDLIDIFVKNGIEVGLVTNGRKWRKWDMGALRNLRWLRMSISDEYDFTEFGKQMRAISGLRGVDVALSYVITDKPHFDNMRTAMYTVNELGLTHIRFVNNIIDPEKASVDFRDILNGIETDRAIIQPRQDFEPGATECLIALCKPVIGADEKIYPCCGVQYAAEEKSLDLTSAFRMGDMADAADIWRHQWAFDGTRCARCYYGGYNRILSAMAEPVRHIEFL
jgi:organic radical activating enzyme